MSIDKNLLSSQDTICLLELIDLSLTCTKENDLRTLISRLKYLIPYNFATCIFSKKEGSGIIDPNKTKVININYPNEWIELYIKRKYYQIDPIIKENFTHFRLQWWADTYKINDPPKEFLSTAEDFGLKKGYTHGVSNLKGDKGGLFSFSGMSIEHNKRTEAILNLIVPHFYQALVRILKQDNKKNILLSLREKEVLLWIAQGKSTWDISRILHISERTVKFHISNIMQKLDVVNRPQAVAVAIEQGLIDIG